MQLSFLQTLVLQEGQRPDVKAADNLHQLQPPLSSLLAPRLGRSHWEEDLEVPDPQFLMVTMPRITKDPNSFLTSFWYEFMS